MITTTKAAVEPSKIWIFSSAFQLVIAVANKCFTKRKLGFNFLIVLFYVGSFFVFHMFLGHSYVWVLDPLTISFSTFSNFEGTIQSPFPRRCGAQKDSLY